jgi:hypothetical protein
MWVWTAVLTAMTFLLMASPTMSAVQAASASTASTTFAAPLTAASGVTTSASGEALFWLAPNGTALEYILIVDNIQNAFMAHIHLAPSGDILVWLAPNPNTAKSGEEASCVGVLSGGAASACAALISGSFSGVYGQGTITASDLSGASCVGCDNVTFTQLMTDIQAGNAYVNVHTTQNPAGEIQGTIVPATDYVAPLGAVKGVTTSAGGEAVFWLAPNGTALEYALVVSNIQNAFMAHIHLAPSGDILVWLGPNPNTATSGEESGCVAVLSGGPASACGGLISGSFSGVYGQGIITTADMSGSKTCAGCDNVTFTQLMTDIQAGNAYVNVHTTQNPAGEVQGTIVPATGATTPLPEFNTSALLITMFGAVAAVALLTRMRLVGGRSQGQGVNSA